MSETTPVESSDTADDRQLSTTDRATRWVRRLSLVGLIVSTFPLIIATLKNMSPAMTPPHYPSLSPAYTSPFAGPVIPSEIWPTLAVFTLVVFLYWRVTALCNRLEETP